MLTFDAAVAVGAAIGAVHEMAQRSLVAATVLPATLYGPYAGPVSLPFRRVGGALFPHQVTVHPSLSVLVLAVLTALPLAARRLYPIGVWLTIAAAIVLVHPTYVPPVALGTAIYAAYSAITHSRYRNLAIAVVTVVTFVVAGTLGNELPRFPGRLTAVFAILPACAAGLGIRVLRRRLADSTARASATVSRRSSSPTNPASSPRGRSAEETSPA